jgi:ribonuclease HII
MDSKRLSEKKRELLYQEIIENSKYHIVIFKPKEIDDIGLSNCIAKGLESIQNSLDADIYLFDGNSTFGILGISTMVKADNKIPEVSASSILAKVTHDRAIKEASLLYPEYNFIQNKGYGTKAHIELIKKFGYSPIHRKSFKIKS